MKTLIAILLSLLALPALAQMELEEGATETINIGPVKDANGDPVTTATITQLEVRISKRGGNFANKAQGADCTHDEGGHYKCDLGPSDLDTPGRLEVYINDTTGISPTQEYTVLRSELYAWKHTSSDLPQTPAQIRTALGMATANLDTQLTTITADTNELQSDDIPGLIAGLNDLDAAGVRGALGLAAANLDTQLADIPTTAEVLDAAGLRSALGMASANLDTQLNALPTDADILTQATAALNTAELDEFSDLIEDNAGTFRFTAASLNQAPTGGGGAGDGSGFTAIPWNASWDTEVQSEVTDALVAANLDEFTDLIEDDGGTFRYTANALEQAPTGGGGGLDAAGVRAALGLASANLDTQLQTISNNVGDVLSDTTELQTDNVPGLIAGLNDVSTAQVGTEIANALNTGLSEPGSVPVWGATGLNGWVAWLGALSRNEINQTNSTKTLRNDADNANIATCGVSDDGTTFVRSECQ